MDGRRRNIILVFKHDITILACFVDFGDVTYVHSKQILQANVILNQLGDQITTCYEMSNKEGVL